MKCAMDAAIRVGKRSNPLVRFDGLKGMAGIGRNAVDVIEALGNKSAADAALFLFHNALMLF